MADDVQTTRLKVKPLEWQNLGGGFWYATAPLFGRIRVDHYCDDYEVSWSVSGFTDTFCEGKFDTAQLAKAAAQATYEAGILAVVSHAPEVMGHLDDEAPQNKASENDGGRSGGYITIAGNR